MKSTIYFILFSLLILLSSCGDDCSIICAPGETLSVEDCSCTPNNSSLVETNITETTTWTSDIVYELNGRISVTAGNDLIIEPGTVIKARAGAGENATALIIARGARIFAEGTAQAPIIFTSVADEIQSGQIQSPNLDPNINGLWGGLIILGNAPISGDAASVQFEGISPSDQNGLYGGTEADDFSGILRYVSIRHGGTDIGEGNELNGLTLGGVGSETVVDHIEIVSNVDDGIEFFGGTINCTNLLVFNQGDDAFDADQAYQGTVDNFIGIAGPESDHSLEFDGPEGSNLGTYTFINGSLKGWNDGGTGGGEYADMRAVVTCVIENCYFFNYSNTSDFELDGDPESMNYIDGTIVFRNLEFNTSHLTDGNITVSDIFVDNGSVNAFATNPVDATIVTATNVGANVSEFRSWTLTDAIGELTGF